MSRPSPLAQTVAALGRHDLTVMDTGTDAEVLLRQAFKEKPGPKPAGSSSNNVTETVRGNRRDYTLERLERERPDLRALAAAAPPLDRLDLDLAAMTGKRR